jgi:hypothetical protein
MSGAVEDQGFEADGTRPPLKLRLDGMPHPNRLVLYAGRISYIFSRNGAGVPASGPVLVLCSVPGRCVPGWLVASCAKAGVRPAKDPQAMVVVRRCLRIGVRLMWWILCEKVAGPAPRKRGRAKMGSWTLLTQAKICHVLGGCCSNASTWFV